MLVGRAAEQEALGSLIEAASGGRGGVLLMRGDPGIGKSALLAWAEEHAGSAVVVRVRGVQTEGQIAYAGLFDVFRPFLGRLGELPSPQARALGSALGLEAPRRSDRLAVFGAALAMLMAVAEDTPVLVTIDDAEWLDVASQEALGFTLRRLAAGSIAAVVAARPDAVGPLAEASLPRLDVGGLADEAALELLRSQGDRPMAEHVARALVAASAGNPLALRSFRDLLSERQLTGEEALPDPLPVARAIESAFAKGLHGLSAQARRAILLVAASDPLESRAVRASTDQLGIGPEWVSEATQAGLLSPRGESIWFSHPLVRPIVLAHADPRDVRQAHELLAQHVLHDEPRVWHMAAAAEAPDEAIAAGLDSVATAAAARAAPSVAAHAFERAARLSPEPSARDWRLVRAAAMAHAGNMLEKTLGLAEEVVATGVAPDATGTAHQLRAQVLMFAGRSAEVARDAAAAAEATAARDPRRAAEQYAFAALVGIIHGALGTGLEQAARARELAPRDGSRTDFMTGGAYAFLLTLAGRAEVADAEIAAWPAHPGPSDDPAASFDLLVAVECLTFLGRNRPARQLADLFEGRARAAGDQVALQYALGSRALGEYRSGDWLAAYADASEALRLSSLATRFARAVVLYRIAPVEVGFGHLGDAQAHLADALATSRAYRVSSLRIPALAGHGLLELARDRPRDAIEHLLEADRECRDAGIAPGVWRYSGDLVDAAVHAGRAQLAADHVAYLRAFVSPQAWVRGTVERAEGLLSGDVEAEAHLVAAALEYQSAEAPFDEARALLDLGVRLRRLRRPNDAQASISRALAAFERLRAVPWLEKAARELARAGGLRRRLRTDPQRLSPAELDVAIVVARGATNREAAAELFLSPKTVDHHLSSVYAKLGLRSRTELAHHMAAAAPAD